MEKKYGFGIIGTGMVAHTHAKAIEAIKEAELVGVYNRTLEKAQVFVETYSGEAYDTLEGLLENDQIDIVCICTPSGVHLEPALKAISAGKHCLIEKPLEVTKERCDQIITACQNTRLKAGVIFPTRFNPSSQKVKKVIEESEFGDLVMGDAYTKWYRTPEYYASGAWRGTWELDGGGALMNQGIHAVDLLQWFMGPVKSVQASTANRKHQAIEVEDTVVAILEFKNGALGSIECSTASFPGSAKRVEVRGTMGTVVIEDDELKEWKFAGGDDDKNSMKSQEEGFSGGASDPSAISFRGHQMQMEDFIRAISLNQQPAVTLEEGKKSVVIIQAIYESAKKQEKIFID